MDFADSKWVSEFMKNIVVPKARDYITSTDFMKAGMSKMEGN